MVIKIKWYGLYKVLSMECYILSLLYYSFFSADQNFTADSGFIFEVTVWFPLNF